MACGSSRRRRRWRGRASYEQLCPRNARASGASAGCNAIRDGFTLGEPEYLEGKPLYRLHDLTARSDDTVIVTEGEWCADALAKAGVLATTSGGADSAGSADWRPLAGRRVTIWPDNDEAGWRYADAVASVLRELDSTVRVVDVDALALPRKADAVDWLAGNADATAADIAAPPTVEATQRDETGKAGATPLNSSANSPAGDGASRCEYGGGRFELAKSGVSFIGTDKDGRVGAAARVAGR